jgi:hypothetical protein
MATLDAGFDISDRTLRRRYDMHRNAQPLAVHAARIADAAAAVDRIAARCAVNDFTVAEGKLLAPVLTRLAQILLAHFVSRDRDFDFDRLAVRLAARDPDHRIAQR